MVWGTLLVVRGFDGGLGWFGGGSGSLGWLGAVWGVSMDRDTRVCGKKNRVAWFTCFFSMVKRLRVKRFGWSGVDLMSYYH